jgi:hypothetical protein
MGGLELGEEKARSIHRPTSQQLQRVLSVTHRLSLAWPFPLLDLLCQPCWVFFCASLSQPSSKQRHLSADLPRHPRRSQGTVSVGSCVHSFTLWCGTCHSFEIHRDHPHLGALETHSLSYLLCVLHLPVDSRHNLQVAHHARHANALLHVVLIHHRLPIVRRLHV